MKQEQQKIKSDILKQFKSKVKKTNTVAPPAENLQMDEDGLSILNQLNSQIPSLRETNPMAQTYFYEKEDSKQELD